MSIEQGGESDHQKTLRFVATYRKERGLPPVGNPESLKEGLNREVSLIRYRAPGRQFALVGSPEVRDALVAAGAGHPSSFRRVPEGKEWWDLPLPGFLWEFIHE